MAQGHNNQQAADIVGVHRETAQQWRNRWLEAIDTLTAVELGGMDDKELQALIVESISPRSVGRFLKGSRTQTASERILV